MLLRYIASQHNCDHHGHFNVCHGQFKRNGTQNVNPPLRNDCDSCSCKLNKTNVITPLISAFPSRTISPIIIRSQTA
jgi:hypothetical protein